MNAVEIEQAVSELISAPFDAEAFPYDFLAAFGNKATTIKRLRSTGKGSTNKSDIPGGVLQRSNIHLAVCDPGKVGDTLKAILASPTTESQKSKYALATDGQTIEAENLVEGETLVCDYADLPNHFGFFLPLAGITTVKQIRDNAFDIKATSRLNRLYVELLKHNPDWDTAERREDLNHFFARLIFCFFAEDTGIFTDESPFTATIDQMTQGDTSITHEVLAEVFRAMGTKSDDRQEGGFPSWADKFQYVNGGLFEGCITGADVPTFTKIARSYLLHIGGLDWTKINPDIFGSMIQAVADDEERGALGMHYTSVPNILKVLNPLFLDDLWAKLEEAGDPRKMEPGSAQGSRRKLLNLRNRMARIRVFDPACGSGNFLVIAYKQMREIEAEINKRRGEEQRRTDIPLTNYRGIELRHFACEIARLALVIAEFQCDALHRGETLARAEFLPLDQRNWITHGNALRIDWLTVCPPTGTEAKMHADDLFETPLDQAEIDFDNEGGETFICGNPPYLGRKYQSADQKKELKDAFGSRCSDTLSLDYVTGWFIKAVDYMDRTEAEAAFVATNSVCQGIQVPILWPVLTANGSAIKFAYTSFHWANLASNNAGVTVSIIGLTKAMNTARHLYGTSKDGETASRVVSNINAYLVSGTDVFVSPVTSVPDMRTPMQFGNHPYYANALMLRRSDLGRLIRDDPHAQRFIRPLYGSSETISGNPRYCIWIEDDDVTEALDRPPIAERVEMVRNARLDKAKDKQSLKLANAPHRFRDQYTAERHVLIVPIVSSEAREYLAVEMKEHLSVVHNKAFALYDAPLWNMAVISARLHRVWIGTVCARLRNDPSYSNTLGWNTFPLPPLTEQNQIDLTRCAEDLLLARESYWPATIADMYDPDRMDDEFPEVRAAHERNDETLERIYIGRRFRNDTERLEKLFEMYTQMTERERSA